MAYTAQRYNVAPLQQQQFTLPGYAQADIVVGAAPRHGDNHAEWALYRPQHQRNRIRLRPTTRRSLIRDYCLPLTGTPRSLRDYGSNDFGSGSYDAHLPGGAKSQPQPAQPYIALNADFKSGRDRQSSDKLSFRP